MYFRKKLTHARLNVLLLHISLHLRILRFRGRLYSRNRVSGPTNMYNSISFHLRNATSRGLFTNTSKEPPYKFKSFGGSPPCDLAAFRVIRHTRLAVGTVDWIPPREEAVIITPSTNAPWTDSPVRRGTSSPARKSRRIRCAPSGGRSGRQCLPY